MRWQVGNGQNIKIWGDKWLPNSSTFKVISMGSKSYKMNEAVASPVKILQNEDMVTEVID